MLKESLHYIKREYLYCTLLVLVFFIPLSQVVSAKLLAISVLLSLVSFNWGKWQRFLIHSWDLLLLFTISVIGLLYTESLKAGLSELETRLSLLGIPFILAAATSYDLANLKRLYRTFALGLTIACLICLGNAIILYGNTGNGSVFVYYNLTNILNFQPTYFAYYIVFAITIAVFELYNSRQNIVLVVIQLLFLFLMLMLTGGQTAFISILFIFSFSIFKYFTEENKTAEKSLAIGLIAVLLITMFTVSLKVKNDIQPFTDSWDRFVIWESALKASPDLIFGVGTGNAKTVLDNYYMANGLEKFANKGYNSHNQFIQSLFSNGILGLLAIVLLLTRPLYLAFKSNNVLGILIIFPFLIYGITEVFLGRYQGVIFFTMLHQFSVISSGAIRNYLSKTGLPPQLV